MQTFTECRPMTVDPFYKNRRKLCLNKLSIDELDAPIVGLIDDLCKFPFCFTIQSCFGHFLCQGQEDPNNIQPLPSPGKICSVEYRIAYIAICIEDSHSGRKFLRWIKQFADLDPLYVQYGCAEWFWERYPNSYVLQVEPERDLQNDKCTVDFQEALHIEKVRNKLYDDLMTLVSNIHKA